MRTISKRCIQSAALAISVLLGLATPGAAHARKCPANEASLAEVEVDHLDSWTKLQSAFKTHGHCDDGSIAEGYSEAVARLLVDQWDTLPELARLAQRDSRFRRFVLRHIDSTLNTSDLEKIGQLSSSACPHGNVKLCRDLQGALQIANRVPQVFLPLQ